MSLVQPSSLEQFYEPLVGDAARVDELKDLLTELVNPGSEEFDYTNPYLRLYEGAASLIDRAASRIPDAGGTEKLAIRNNGDFAMGQTVSVVEAVGKVYEARAKVPQDIDRVQRSTDKALLHLYGIAFSDNSTAFINLVSYFRGRNPRNPLSYAAAKYILLASRLGVRQPPLDSVRTRAFSAEEDEAGQLDVRPKFKRRLPKKVGQKCPASEIRTGEVSGQRSALWMLMGAVGEVAVKEIFPNYFPIADSTETSI